MTTKLRSSSSKWSRKKDAAALTFGVGTLRRLLHHLREHPDVALAWAFTSHEDHPAITSISAFDRRRLAATGMTMRAALIWAEAAVVSCDENTAALAIYLGQNLSRLIYEEVRAAEARLKNRYPEIGKTIAEKISEAAKIHDSLGKIVCATPKQRQKNPDRELMLTVRKAIRLAQMDGLTEVRHDLIQTEAKIQKIEHERGQK
jgi:hypothetical protein